MCNHRIVTGLAAVVCGAHGGSDKVAIAVRADLLLCPLQERSRVGVGQIVGERFVFTQSLNLLVLKLVRVHGGTKKPRR